MCMLVNMTVCPALVMEEDDSYTNIVSWEFIFGVNFDFTFERFLNKDYKTLVTELG